ncbi:PepSY domain-containing protein [Sphingomicrobium astaxanthinifaciens]|uniref:PepSY domain-containing protein n=1 Tax=Sphingomicrobium astaxanthinifaciens TaxID=1227949 RepID=UPI001FCC8098|nr:PepSY domain-containing protein [Sphingomicrobium astaxanthinifaciens]MCJ7420732.1 PepSY domain-containing protein [Sphingomicrobium astaxanthinifaciens]
MLATPAAAVGAFQPEPPRLQRDQDRAYDRARSGNAMALPQLERRIVPRMNGYQYLGPELRGNTYRFKFVRDGRLVWIDVDPRTGRVVGTSGR